MDWDALETFAVVCRTLSFSAAARRLHVSHATVSDRVKRLERQLGVTLLERSTHHVRVTAEGELLLAAHRDMQRRWQRVRRSLLELGTREPTPLNLALFDISPVRLHTHLDRLPFRQVELSVVEKLDAALSLVAGGEMDGALLYLFDGQLATTAIPDDLQVQTIVRERLHVMLPAAHRAATREGIALRDLADAPWIVRAEEWQRNVEIGFLRRHGLEATPAHVTSNMETVRFLVAEQGAVVLSSALSPVMDGARLRPLQDPADSVFLLVRASAAEPDATGTYVVDAVRNWYLEGLELFRSPWLEHARTTLTGLVG